MSENGNSANADGDAGETADSEPIRLGGMALRNGLLIHGPTSWAVAARTASGEIEVASGAKPQLARGKLATTPMLRGPLRLAEALLVVPLARLRLRSARLPFEDPTVLVAMGGSLLATNALRRIGKTGAIRETAIALLGAMPAVTALRDRDLAAYHGAEHKSIGGYETGTDPAEFPKEHGRCGSNLIGPMLAFSITGQIVLERLYGDDPGPIPRALAALIGTGAAVELFSYAERNPDSVAAKAVHGPGHEIQRLVSTREPTSEQMAVGLAALDEILIAEGVTVGSV